MPRQRNFIARSIIESVLRRGSATRQDILADLAIRPATLFAVIRELTAHRVLCEPERKGKKTGRRASPILFDPQYGLFLGLDVDVDHTSGVCLDAQACVRAISRADTSGIRTADNVKNEIRHILADLRRSLDQDWTRVKGIGFADPGLTDPWNGVSLKAVNVQGWKDLPTRAWLREETGLDSVVYPAATARAYAELMARTPTPPASLFHAQLDVGIGGGFVKDESLFIGDSFCAMELGHIIIQENGPLCQCGNHGCLEALAGLAAIRRRVEELNRRGVHTALRAEGLSFAHVCDCVRQQDKAACSLIQDIGECIGAGVAAVITILNPACIVCSGGLATLGEQLLDPIRRVIARRCFREVVDCLELSTSSLPAEATAQGAALIMRRESLLGVAGTLTEKD